MTILWLHYDYIMTIMTILWLYYDYVMTLLWLYWELKYCQTKKYYSAVTVFKCHRFESRYYPNFISFFFIFQIYFMGPYTSLVLTSGKTRYQYFINPPSPLPSWFYEYHRLEYGSKKYVDIPKNVQDEFLKKLLNLLTKFLSFPV